MKDMVVSFLGNDWVIGIGTGLICAMIIAVFSFILNKVRKKTKYKKAHENCVEILEKYIEKNGVPSEAVILSIINVIADNNHLDPEKFNVRKIAEELLLHLIQQEKYSLNKTKKFLSDIENTISNIKIVKFDFSATINNDEFLSEIVDNTMILDIGYDYHKYDRFRIISNVLVGIASGVMAHLFSNKALIIFAVTILGVVGLFSLIVFLKKK